MHMNFTCFAVIWNVSYAHTSYFTHFSLNDIYATFICTRDLNALLSSFVRRSRFKYNHTYDIG